MPEEFTKKRFSFKIHAFYILLFDLCVNYTVRLFLKGLKDVSEMLIKTYI